MSMQAPKVDSSHIHSLGFDSETGEMTVQFHSGGAYRYSGVEESTFNELLNHPSPGTYFHANVRGQYKHRKV